MNRTKHISILIVPALFLLVTLACSPVVTVVVTATPSPAAIVSAATDTPVPGPTGCTLDALLVADVTVPDNTELAPGTAFIKTWQVRNSGTCPWETGTKLVFVSGERMGGPTMVDVLPLPPGDETDVSVNLTSPATPGTYKGDWQFLTPDGVPFGPVIYVQIVVTAPSATATPIPPTQMPTATATLTPVPPAGLAILSFTVDAQDLPPAGKRLTFHWRTTGAISAGIWSLTQMRFPTYWEATPPGEGSLTVDVLSTNYRDPTMTLVAKDAAGNEVQASVEVPWACRYSYFFSTDERACPAYEASTTWAGEQPFEHGRMIWLQEVRSESTMYSGVIIVLYADGRCEKYQDTWTEGEAESDPTIVPPAGLYQPIRGFGKLWRANTAVRDRLGWATAPEQGFTTQWQMQVAESLGVPFFVRRIDGKVIRATGWDVEVGTWQEVP
ncbi:MAG: NBR1-Ig-like domain-containing protein [Anaerolineae bacterium]|nr:NBR1-Ig-like domain-containing protein [Anaerolineae bacterium]MDH7474643.1 NBR1-Ig-like domain-containing protein [Anaerolineae bacterium]